MTTSERMYTWHHVLGYKHPWLEGHTNEDAFTSVRSNSRDAWNESVERLKRRLRKSVLRDLDTHGGSWITYDEALDRLAAIDRMAPWCVTRRRARRDG